MFDMTSVQSWGVKEVPDSGLKFITLFRDNLRIELIEPIDHNDMSNAVAKRLATRGEGLYQLAIFVDDINKEGKELAERGATLIERDPTPDMPRMPLVIRWIVHPKDANGALLELMQTTPELERDGIG